MPLNYQTPPDKDPDRRFEAPNWTLLAITLGIGWALLLAIICYRLFR